jgi:hypothetical protein
LGLIGSIEPENGIAKMGGLKSCFCMCGFSKELFSQITFCFFPYAFYYLAVNEEKSDLFSCK